MVHADVCCTVDTLYRSAADVMIKPLRIAILTH